MNNSPRYRVMLVDDASAVREALRWLLEATPDLLVVGEAGDGVEALLLAADLQPDAVILDVELPRLDGCTVAALLRALPHPPVIIFLTIHTDAATRRCASEIGDGFVEKGIEWQAIITHLRAAIAAHHLYP